MRLGIFAKTFPGSDPASVLAQVRAAGFATAQYNMACSGLPPMPDEIAPAVSAAVAEASRQTGIRLCAVSGTYNMAHPDPAIRAQGLRQLEVIASTCAAMGTGLITLCTGTRDPDDQWRHHRDNGSAEAWRDMLAEMEKAVAIAERFGLRLGIEPELANIVSDAARARRLLDEMKSERLAIVLDPANLFERRSSASSAASSPRLSTFSPTASSWATPRIARPMAASRPPARASSTFRTICTACAPPASTAIWWRTGWVRTRRRASPPTCAVFCNEVPASSQV